MMEKELLSKIVINNKKVSMGDQAFSDTLQLFKVLIAASVSRVKVE